MNDLERLTERYPALAGMKEEIAGAFRILKESYETEASCLYAETEAALRIPTILWAN